MMRAYLRGGCDCGGPADSWTRVSQDRVFPVFCAWCPKKGRETVIRYATNEDSHGICGACQRENFPQTVRAT
jgi:hypothetical protein